MSKSRHLSQQPKVRDQVRERAGNQCEICGIAVSPDFPENDPLFASMHHRYPRRDGGQDRITNLLYLCRRCHVGIVHRDEEKAVENGWLCLDNKTEKTPVVTRAGLMFLSPFGKYNPALLPITA